MTDPIQRYSLNRSGTDYVVGDIHGELRALQRGLEGLGFDEESDRLFSVGDLIDRGPDSTAMLAWLDYPWFHAVMGNHEEMALQAATDWEQLLWWVSVNGGGWWLDEPPERREQFLARFRQLPLVIEVETMQGTVGILHGDVPPQMNWQDFVHALKRGNPDVRHYCLWGRGRAEGAVRHGVSDIYRVFTGHTPISEIAHAGNTYMIDTGACYGGNLTIVPLTEVTPTRPRREKALADAR